MRISGVKCDNPNCGWIDEHGISLDELKQWVGKRCPECGKSIIVTQEEYNLAASLYKWERRLSKIMKFFHLKPKGILRVKTEPLRWGEKAEGELFKATDDDLKEHEW